MYHTHRDETGPYSICWRCGEVYRDNVYCSCPPPDLRYDDEPQCTMCGEPIDSTGEDGICSTCWDQELLEDSYLDEDILLDLYREDQEQQARDDYDNMISKWEG